MKLAFALASLAVLAACSDVPLSAPAHGRPPPVQASRDHWGYQPGQQAPSIISDAEAASLTDEVINQKAMRSTLANNLPRVTDPATRAQHIRIINEIDARLQPLEYRLRAAGRPVPR
jgi:hypothetical protein